MAGTEPILPDYDLLWDFKQMFIARPSILRDGLCLAFYFIIIPLLVYRARNAPALIPLILHALISISAFIIRRVSADDPISIHTARANQSLLAIAFLFLCYQLVILKAEQYHLHGPENSEIITSKLLPTLRRRRHLFIHLLSLLLLGAFALAIAHSALLGRRANQDSSVVRRLYFAFVIVMFIFLGSLLLLMIGLPYNNYENDSSTGLFLILMGVMLLAPVIYLYFRYTNSDSSTSWLRNSAAAFFVLWCLPQIVVTVSILLRPIQSWYPNSNSRWLAWNRQ